MAPTRLWEQKKRTRGLLGTGRVRPPASPIAARFRVRFLYVCEYLLSRLPQLSATHVPVLTGYVCAKELDSYEKCAPDDSSCGRQFRPILSTAATYTLSNGDRVSSLCDARDDRGHMLLQHYIPGRYCVLRLLRNVELCMYPEYSTETANLRNAREQRPWCLDIENLGSGWCTNSTTIHTF